MSLADSNSPPMPAIVVSAKRMAKGNGSRKELIDKLRISEGRWGL